ncbi:MAG: hypothetical protein RIC36_14730 [Rhodospirillales bacterium]
MIQGVPLEIARYLTERAGKGARTTYEQVAKAIGWSHPTGRGLGNHLEELMAYCRDNSLPPLTLIVVKKTTSLPSPDAMPSIISALGEIDVPAEQEWVFDFDWSSVSEFSPPESTLPLGRPVWLTSFWGFDPNEWGCIGFANDGLRHRFISDTVPGTLMVIYITKANGPEEMRGKVVGILEVSHETGHASEFISGDRWAKKENDTKTRGKWPSALRATRAWKIATEDWKPVEELFPTTYGSTHPELIGSRGVFIEDSEAVKLLDLNAYEVPVYGQKKEIGGDIEKFRELLKPSHAIRPAQNGFTVGETDGPKHLYILNLTGDVAAYLGRPSAEVDEMMIVKVGFSKSPVTRRDQIQSSYPDGSFKWEVYRPKEIPRKAPYPNADVAIAGEDAMKARLVDEGAESLGGEFFLAPEWLVCQTWFTGTNEAEKKKAEFSVGNSGVGS